MAAFQSALYIFYLQPLITDIIFGLIYMCYLAPSIIIHGDLITNRVGWYVSTVVDALQSYCWSCNSLSQVTLAVNRFIVTVLLQPTFFTMNRAIFLSIIQDLLALTMTAFVHFILPCCSIAFSYKDFGYREVEMPGVPNYVFAYVSMPVKIACAIIPIVIYCMILISVRTNAIRFKLQSPERRKRRKQELRFAAQFALIALVYTLASFSFTLLMAVSPSDCEWIKGIPVLLGLLNSTSNAVVYLLNEKKKVSVVSFIASSTDWQRALKMIRIKKKLVSMVEETRMRLSQ